jgi:hypothetical protein
MDRFSTKNDAQDQPTYAYCCMSGNEIFLGETYLETFDGEILKDDFETLMNYYFVKRKVAGDDID